MKRAVIFVALAALPLGACSSKAKPDDTVAVASGAAKEEHVNPWAKDPPQGSQTSEAATDKSKPKS